jgi:periplasmic glucans biosynthesis protein
MTFYALLRSKSLTGAYRFVLGPEGDTRLEVEARLFARADVARLGVAPLTSMFLYGENRGRHFDDYRPEVHDSDGLLEQSGTGEWIWRPLINPSSLQVTSLRDQDPKGFGLVQRDRRFDHYLDPEARYDRRPSLWATPEGDWGKGGVELVEIPAQDETNDNITAFWAPDRPFQAGEEHIFRYRLRAFGAVLPGEDLARVRRTRLGWGGIPGASHPPPRSLRQIIVDFQGGELARLDSSQPVSAHLSTSAGTVMDKIVQRLPAGQGWRVAFKLRPDRDRPADMRLYLTLRGRRLSETWSCLWSPESRG